MDDSERPPTPADSALIAATLELLGEIGPTVSTRRIAERAGVSEVTLFRRFATKDRLFEAAVQTAVEPFSTALVGNVDGDPRAELVSIARGYAEFVDTHADMVAKIMPAVTTLFAGSVLPMQRELASIIRTRISPLSTSRGDVDEMIAAFLGPILARSTLRHLLTFGEFDAEAHVARFLHGWQTT